MSGTQLPFLMNIRKTPSSVWFFLSNHKIARALRGTAEKILGEMTIHLLLSNSGDVNRLAQSTGSRSLRLSQLEIKNQETAMLS